MKMLFFKKLIVLLFIALGWVCTSFVSIDDEWVLQKSSPDVLVYSRNLENQEVKQLRAVTKIKTSLSSIIALLNDREACPKWVYKCEKSYIIKKVSDQEYYSYQNVVAPWPVDNRDIVFNVKISQDPATKVVTHNAMSKPDYISNTKGHIRVKTFNSIWTLTPLKDGTVICENQILVDPGGSLPTWLVNMAAVDGPFETTTNLRKVVLEEKYQKAQLDYIEEPN